MEPRAGIINLDFVDATQIGKAINDNDPWKQAIQTAGTAVIDRERDILYRRALAKAMGLQAPQETTAVEGVSKAYDWIKTKGGKAYDTIKEYGGKIVPTEITFKNPFVVEEKSYDEGVRIESPVFDGEMSREDAFAGGISREQNMSRLPAPVQTGTKTVFPTTVVGKDRKVEAVRGAEGTTSTAPNMEEYDNELAGGMSRVSDGMTKFTPEGERVSFPTTIVGAPGTRLPADKTGMTQDSGSEIVSPVADGEVVGVKLQAPESPKRLRSETESWSEMYRLNKDRANFDYGRKKDNDVKRSQVYTPEQKSIIDAKQQNRIRMGEIQGTINTMQTETSRKPWVNQLKTLAANDVALNDQLARLNTPGYKLSEQSTATKTEPTGTDTGLVEISPTVNAGKFLEFSNGFDIENYKNKSQTPSAASIQAQARESGYDLSKEEAETIAGTLDKKVEARNEEKARLAEEARKAGTYARSLAKDKAEVGALSLAYNKLATNPDDKTYKSSALTSILRKESGAAIGSSEFMGRMKEWLPESDYNQLMNEMNSVGMIVAGKFSPNAAELWANRISDNYLDKINTPKMMEFIYAVLPDYADVPGKGIKASTTTAKPTKSKGETVKQYMDRLNAWKAKGGK